MCINLIAEYIIQSYFAHFQSLFLSLFLFSTWCQSHFLVAFIRQNPAFLRCYGFTFSSPRSQTLSPFLPSLESSSPSCCSTQAQFHWIDLIKIYPLPPKSVGSSTARAPMLHQKFLVLQPRADQRRHAHPRASRTFLLCCHVNPSDVSATSALVTAAVNWTKKKKTLSFTVFSRRFHF